MHALFAHALHGNAGAHHFAQTIDVERIDVEHVEAGEIAVVAGLLDVAIGETLAGFEDAMRAGDLDAAVSHIAPEQQDGYRELIAANPDGMASFGELLAKAEMSFLSAHDPTTPFNRTAEYALELDGVTFYLVFIKTESGWRLYDF